MKSPIDSFTSEIELKTACKEKGFLYTGYMYFKDETYYTVATGTSSKGKSFFYLKKVKIR